MIRTILATVGIIALLFVGQYLDFWFGHQSLYTPRRVKCPEDEPIIRPVPFGAQSISTEEEDWVENRDEQVRTSWKAYLERVNLEDFDVDAYVAKKKLPRVAVTFSGGGSRALLVGGGVIRAMDDRIPESRQSGTGGILQLSTYISGLSGGSFLIGSMYTTNFPTIDFLHDNVWHLETDTFTPAGKDELSDVGVYVEFIRDVAHKSRAGYPTTLTDYWARLVSVHTTNETRYGEGVTMSGLAEFENMAAYKTPFPVVVWNERLPGQKDLNEFSNIWESSVFDTGSWSPTISAFIKTKYLGTSVNAGVPTGRCTVNFDHFGYVVGISSSVFNQALQDMDKDNSTRHEFLSAVIRYITDAEQDGALLPNPFYHLEHVDERTANVKAVSLVDGGEDGQNIPIWPFLQPARKVDVIFATDSTVSFYEGGWPNGSSIISTAEYAANTSIAFPPTPATAEIFLEQGLHNRTVFFGCHKSPEDYLPGQWPLLVYIPNRYYDYPSNASTFRRVYPKEDSWPFLMNGYSLLATAEAQHPLPESQEAWAACVACALVSRSYDAVADMTAQCRKCMADYCWDDGPVRARVDGSRPSRGHDSELERKLEAPEGEEEEDGGPMPAPEKKPAAHEMLRDPLFWVGAIVAGLLGWSIAGCVIRAWRRKNEDERRPLIQ
ncbi:Lysophospholipase 1 [Irineochytrium annulatum]|nr:Lysophospholipase 1 [Irineochytrium annulatum]